MAEKNKKPGRTVQRAKTVADSGKGNSVQRRESHSDAKSKKLKKAELLQQDGKRQESAAAKPDGERQNIDEGSKQIWKGGNMLYPVPAVMVSCQRPGEKPNIITLAWAGTICTNPPMVSVSIRPERYSYAIIKETGSFVINLTTEQLTYAMDWCGVRSGRHEDKFARMHLSPGRSSSVEAPLIEESPINLECRVEQVLELGSHHMFLARVEAVDVAETLLDDKGTLHLERAKLIAYSHGGYYALGKRLGSFGYSVRKKAR